MIYKCPLIFQPVVGREAKLELLDAILDIVQTLLYLPAVASEVSLERDRAVRAALGNQSPWPAYYYSLEDIQPYSEFPHLPLLCQGSRIEFRHGRSYWSQDVLVV